MGEPLLPEEILAHYEHEVDEGSRITSGLAELELLRTREIIRRHLPPRKLRILDVGGGTGVHASWLAADGHTVHLVDPVPRHVEAARSLSSDGLAVTAEIGEARSLDAPTHSFDAALLLGPLYHLTQRSERVAALGEARRVVVPGGLVFAAAISRFASLFDGLAKGYLFDPEFRAIVEQDLNDGQHRRPRRDETRWFTTAYFHHPDELVHEAVEGGLDEIRVLGVEGIAAWLPHLRARWNDPRSRELMLFSARAVESEPTLRGVSSHLLLVARTPA